MGFKLSQIDENIVRLKLMGDFDSQDALDYPEQLEPHLQKTEATGKQLHIYTDTSDFGKLSVEGRRVLSDANKDNRQGKVAATGVNRIVGMLARFIMVASGRNNIRFFDTEDEALNWLKEPEA